MALYKQDPIAAKGYAQVFDTTSIYKNYLAMQEKRNKDFKESLVNIDTSKIWDRDVDKFNTELWNPYLKFVKENYKALKNPRKNIDTHLQKKRMEQEMLQFAKSSNQAQKYAFEGDKYLLTKQLETTTNKEGKDNWDSWKNKSGDFTNGLTYLQQIPKDINTQQQALYRSLKSSTIEKSTLETPIDPNNPSKGSTTTTSSKVDMAQWDAGIEAHYNTNPKYAKQVDANFERAKENAGEELYMPFTYFNEDENKEVTEDVLIESGLQYDIVTSRANLPKGSEKLTYTNPSKFNFNMRVSLGDGKKHTFGTIESRKDDDIASTLGSEYNRGSFVYSQGSGSQARRKVNPSRNAGAVIVAEDGTVKEGAITGYPLSHIKVDDKYYIEFSKSRAGGELNKKRKELEKAEDPTNFVTGREIIYDQSYIDKYGNIEGAEINISYVPNPAIAILQKEIAELEKREGTDEIVLIPLDYGVNEDMLETYFGKGFDFDAVKKQHGDTSKKKKKIKW